MSKTSSKKARKFVAEDPLYNFSYCVYAGGTPKDAANYFHVPDLDGGEEAPHTAGVTISKEGSNAVVIWFPTTTVHYLTISHEATHAILFMFHERGITAPSYGNDEHFTYLHDWLVSQIVKKLTVVWS